jgi:hypothetical protein
MRGVVLGGPQPGDASANGCSASISTSTSHPELKSSEIIISDQACSTWGKSVR